jgi:ferritin-like metal-binding protein YciE
MVEKTLNDLFYETLKDIYYAERQIFRTLPKMAKGATLPDLKLAFTHHREETEGQIQRLEQVFELISKPARGKTCEAIKGILEEGSETLETFENSPALDAGLVADGQAVEHYEMARYGALISWALQLGMKDVADLLSQNLQEEKAADQLLTKLGSSMANKKAA